MRPFQQESCQTSDSAVFQGFSRIAAASRGDSAGRFRQMLGKAAKCGSEGRLGGVAPPLAHYCEFVAASALALSPPALP